MSTNSLGRWVVRLLVVGVLGIAGISAAHWFTPQDSVWAANVLPGVSVGR